MNTPLPTREELLASGEYFICEQYNCLLRKEICIRRQQSQKKNWGDSGSYYESIFCAECEQGKKIKAEAEGKKICEMCGKIYEYEPASTCATQYYCSECMKNSKYKHSFDSKKGRLVLIEIKQEKKPAKQKSLRLITKKGDEKAMEKVICRECGKEFEPWKNGKSIIKKICRECMVKKRNKKIIEAKRTQLSINFTDHPELYSYLEQRAKKNFRDPAMEILAILHEMFSSRKEEG